LKLINTILPSFLSVDPPNVVQHPKDLQIPTGAEATFSIEAEGDHLTYQWLKNGSNVCKEKRYHGAATNTLTIHQVNKSDAGSYKCVVKNEGNKDGEVSEEAQLTVCMFHLIWYTALSVVMGP